MWKKVREYLSFLTLQQNIANRLDKKYPNAGQSLTWQFLFPSSTLSKDPRADAVRRHHVFPTTIQSHIKRAIKNCGIHKQASCHLSAIHLDDLD